MIYWLSLPNPAVYSSAAALNLLLGGPETEDKVGYALLYEAATCRGLAGNALLVVRH